MFCPACRVFRIPSFSFRLFKVNPASLYSRYVLLWLMWMFSRWSITCRRGSISTSLPIVLAGLLFLYLILSLQEYIACCFGQNSTACTLCAHSAGTFAVSLSQCGASRQALSVFCKDIEYIETFYNRHRAQKRLGYLNPVQFLNAWQQQTLSCSA